MKSSAQSSEVGPLSLKPMTPDEAKMIVRRLMGSYPSQKLADPEIYLAELVTLLCGYPQWAGESASRVARDKSPTFIPSVGEIKRELDEQVGTFKRAAEWEAGAQRLLAAPPDDPVMRDRMRQKLEGLADSLRVSQPRAKDDRGAQLEAQRKAILADAERRRQEEDRTLHDNGAWSV